MIDLAVDTMNEDMNDIISQLLTHFTDEQKLIFARISDEISPTTEQLKEDSFDDILDSAAYQGVWDTIDDLLNNKYEKELRKPGEGGYYIRTSIKTEENLQTLLDAYPDIKTKEELITKLIHDISQEQVEAL